MPNYIDVIYDKKIRPHTKYPDKLCSYLFNRFNMSKGQTLLDLGCGRGDFAKAFESTGLLVKGLDLQKSSADILQGIEVFYANFEHDKFPFKDESFDVVFSKSVIEHIQSPQHFIKETRRILKPGGRIITMTPDWHTQQLIFYDDYTHVHPYTVTGLKDMLVIFDFKNIQVEKFYQLPILWKYPQLKILSKTLQLFGPVKKIYKNKFIRWSRELMILAYGEK